MDFSDKQEGWIETGTAIGTGILAWEAAATQKYVANYGKGSLFQKARFADALAGLIGNELTKKIFPDWQGAADLSPNIMGAINKFSMTGAAILIIDAIVKAVVPEYKKLPAVSSIVKGAGMGVLGGGIVGGIFDPPSRGTITPKTVNMTQNPQGVYQMQPIAGAF